MISPCCKNRTHQGDQLIHEHVGEIQQDGLFSRVKRIARVFVHDAESADVDSQMIPAISQRC
jgi:hypothetical protein